MPRLDPAFGSRFFSLLPDRWLWQLTLALASALLLIASFPKFELSYLAWVAMAPLIYVLAQGVSLRRAFCLGWISGTTFTFMAENWIAHSMSHYGEMLTVLAYGIALLFASVLGLFTAIFAGAMSRLVARFGWPALTLSPVVWVATEWLRPQVTGVTWNALGVSQAKFYPIARLAQYGGVYLISAEIVACSALLVLFLRLKERAVGRAAALLLLFAGMAFVPTRTQNPVKPLEGAVVTIVGVQPNLPPDSSNTPDSFARDLENNVRLTREGLDRAPGKTADIVVWAESPLPLFYENDPALRQRIDQLAQESGSYLILSTVTREGQSYFNSIDTIRPQADPTNGAAGQNMKRYDKNRLVPFGEFVPWRPVLGRFVPPIVGDFTPGREQVVNLLKLEARRAAVLSGSEISPDEAIERTTNFIRVGSFICYEAAYPEIVRGFVRNGATLLVNVSNDAWFGNTAGAQQHLAHAMIRAIETDRDLVRVTNSGISGLITADGRVVEPLPVFSAGAQVWQAQSRRGQTYYVRHGDWFALGCVIASLIALALTGLPTKSVDNYKSLN